MSLDRTVIRLTVETMMRLAIRLTSVCSTIRSRQSYDDVSLLPPAYLLSQEHGHVSLLALPSPVRLCITHRFYDTTRSQ